MPVKQVEDEGSDDYVTDVEYVGQEEYLGPTYLVELFSLGEDSQVGADYHEHGDGD